MPIKQTTRNSNSRLPRSPEASGTVTNMVVNVFFSVLLRRLKPLIVVEKKLKKKPRKTSTAKSWVTRRTFKPQGNRWFRITVVVNNLKSEASVLVETELPKVKSTRPFTKLSRRQTSVKCKELQRSLTRAFKQHRATSPIRTRAKFTRTNTGVTKCYYLFRVTVGPNPVLKRTSASIPASFLPKATSRKTITRTVKNKRAIENPLGKQDPSAPHDCTTICFPTTTSPQIRPPLVIIPGLVY